METHVSINNLRKVFKSNDTEDVRAIDGISLDIPQGQFLAVMGPSGSGKTTLLHLIAGLAKPTSGDVIINGTNLASLNDHQLTLFRRRNIGVIFQSFNLIPTLTTEENIMLPILAGFHEIDKAKLDSALTQLIERLQLGHRRNHYPDTLSGGEQQRAAIARALLIDFATDSHGSLLLADEPTGNLDSANSDIICNLLQSLCKERRHTTVVVTHESAVAQHADRIIHLKDGRIAE
ncbi:MAG: ABC transporter ATP-binding protein [Lentisphaeria bacterium]|nr:ABC transporter ATP-binding protein [Lentisphaeria bacterium]